MKKTLHIALLMVMLTTSLFTVQAADNKPRQWTKDMLEYKHDFIVKETNMTQAQRDKFMPHYEAMEKEIFAIHRNAREQAKKVKSGKVSDQDYAKAARVMAEVKAKEGEIETKYFDIFSTILTKKQLFLLKQAEIKFTRQMVSKGKK